MKIEPFRPDHLENLLLQPTQEYLRAFCESSDCARKYVQHGFMALVDKDGVTLGIAGLVPLWPGRAMAEALLSKNIGGAGMVAATRAIRRAFDISEFSRIEAYVDHELEIAQRWIRMLGFECETPSGMRNFSEGRTFDLFARTQ